MLLPLSPLLSYWALSGYPNKTSFHPRTARFSKTRFSERWSRGDGISPVLYNRSRVTFGEQQVLLPALPAEGGVGHIALRCTDNGG